MATIRVRTGPVDAATVRELLAQSKAPTRGVQPRVLPSPKPDPRPRAVSIPTPRPIVEETPPRRRST
jgi:hypothetical protein